MERGKHGGDEIMKERRTWKKVAENMNERKGEQGGDESIERGEQ